MPAVADPQDTDVLGVVDNAAPGAVCQICQLGKRAQKFAAAARQSGFTYQEIADALSDGLGRPISQKALWHHLHHKGMTS